ncbi:Peptidoglycan/LPS O-acetylase OafA/YrhL, contains acyltransferase and SGNH-hydrolase domains [Methylobacterium phyllostachyos]|uniref:Peptidoglycan/LPS O-acetylase OafA/YrhL, contains acyltransferase and SGNH-hydrolase domains n=1 Tax=Methylobacterium phyllostachyos TaxID=582672 RepID=A0A1H0DKD2_9HYPH|nr:acyltransferase [Methylobacterium phyllostachyos]SDN70461.1 Peptidoglycan/LPS O-acetylase OafA/YrhL, contains acyltransferase and SGNH-hydrolase domains [Methylobacterium phyllostachyos]
MAKAVAGRANNFGTLRLLFAALVILAHAPELVDSDRSRELLTRVFGTLSFGEVAVDGFFLVSGYLITASYRAKRSFADYVMRRVRRIYPGFVVASLLCIAVVAPLAGGDLAALSPPETLARLALLLMPVVPGAFADLPYPMLDGSMWTIPCEFGCYLLLGLVGTARALRRRGRYLAMLAGLSILLVLRWLFLPIGHPGDGQGSLSEMIRLSFVFACGGAFQLFADRIAYTGRGAALAAGLLLPLLFSPPLAEPAFALLGGYLIFWFAFAVRPLALSRATAQVDPSYGLYLYAWPIQNLLIAWVPGLAPWTGAALTLAAALPLGILSWFLVERPMLRPRPGAAGLAPGEALPAKAVVTP